MEKGNGSVCCYVCKNAERRYSAVILFAVYDGGIKTMAEPHLAASVDAARLSLGRFFIEHEDMKDRIDSTSVVVLGDWDHEYGLRSLAHDSYPASECIEYYLQEVKKQNESAMA